MIATRDAYGEVLVELGEEYPDIVVLDADLSSSTKTGAFAKKWPHRHFNFGVAEQNMMATAAGLAAAGKIPFASTFAVFGAGRPFDQIRQVICYANNNVKIVVSHAGLTVGEDGATHQMLEDVALMRSLPRMTVIVPADGVETKQAIRAVVQRFGPTYVRLGRAKVPVVLDDTYRFEVGKAGILREGQDVAVIACGVMVARALGGAEILAAEGVQATVVNCSTIKPIDVETLTQVAGQCGAVVTAEEHQIHGGLGSAVAEVLGEHCPTPMLRIGMADEFGRSGEAFELLDYYGLTAERIARAAREVVGRKALMTSA